MTLKWGARSTVTGMEISLLYFEGCPHRATMEERLAVVLAERPDATLTRHLVESAAEAERLGFRGSPSVLVDGRDPFAGDGDGVGLACRVYRTPDGPAGAPTLEQLRAVLG